MARDLSTARPVGKLDRAHAGCSASTAGLCPAKNLLEKLLNDIDTKILHREHARLDWYPRHRHRQRSNAPEMAPRRSKPAPPPPPSRTLVLDNGAHTIKAGFVTAGSIDEPRVIPNCIARDRTRKTYVASDLAKCKDFGEISFRRPVEKGYVVNWDAQKEIWDHEFFGRDAAQKCDPAETRLVLTEQPNALPALQANCDQMVFEEFGFASYYRGIGSSDFVLA